MDNNLEDSRDAIEPPASDYGAMRIADALTLTGLGAFAAAGTCLLLARAPMRVWTPCRDQLSRPLLS